MSRRPLRGLYPLFLPSSLSEFFHQRSIHPRQVSSSLSQRFPARMSSLSQSRSSRSPSASFASRLPLCCHRSRPRFRSFFLTRFTTTGCILLCLQRVSCHASAPVASTNQPTYHGWVYPTMPAKSKLPCLCSSRPTNQPTNQPNLEPVFVFVRFDPTH